MEASLLKYTILFGLLITAGLNAFDDKPALTGGERSALVISKAIGATVGAMAAIPPIKIGSERYYDKRPFYIAGAATGIGGSIVMYKTMGQLTNRLLAWRHKVSYAVQKTSCFYGINIEQYRPLLEAAEKKDSDGLRKSIIEIYEQRFGAGWQDKLQEFLIPYKGFAIYLSKVKKSSLSKEECDLMRMVEIGAALETIYFGKKPSRKTMVQQAGKIYPFLGFANADFERDTQEGA